MIQTILFYPFRLVFSRYYDDDELASFLTGAFTVGLLWLLHGLHQAVPDKFIRNRVRSDGSLATAGDDADDISFIDPWNGPLAYVSTQQRRMVRSSMSTMADIQKNIGELPKRFKRKHWPWETIRRKVMGEESDEHKDENKTVNSLNANTESVHEETLGASIRAPVEIVSEEEKKDETASIGMEFHETSSSEKQLCIGSIFGLDVGGTLAKLVYFEKKPMDSDPLHTRTLREKHYVQAFSAQTVLMARRMDEEHNNNNIRPKRSTSMSPMRNIAPPFLGHGESNRYRASTVEEFDMGTRTTNNLLPPTGTSQTLRRRTIASNLTASPHLTSNQSESRNHTKSKSKETTSKRQPFDARNEPKSSEHLKDLYAMRQESLPDDVRQLRNTIDFRMVGEPTFDDSDNKNPQHGKVGKNETVSLSAPSQTPASTKNMEIEPKSTIEPTSNETAGSKNPAFVKRSLSLLDLPSQHEQRKEEALNRFYDFARRLNTQEDSISDIELSFYCRELGGEFHFISFETRKMKNAMDLIRFNNLHMNIKNMGATGGGAHKFADVWKKELGIGIIKQDELDSLVAGMQFVLTTVVGECYTFRPQENSHSQAPNEKDANNGEETSISQEPKGNPKPALEFWTRKVQRDTISYSSAYPYMLVTIGTGVSVLRVDGPRQHERVSGSTIGGGTFWGLMRLLTDVENFEEAMKLAEKGDPTKVDMMVGDIYGEDSDALEKLGLSANIVASSFGKLVSKEDPAFGLTQEDLARALLSLVTNNIGQVAYLNAKLHNTPRIYFVGSFLRLNMISQRRLSYAIDYWSKGEMEALFLEHEGYFGSLGAFLMTQNIEKRSGGFFQWEDNS